MIATFIARAYQAMKPTRITFPAEMLEPFEFESDEGIPSVCNILIVRTIETATVVLFEMPDNPESSLANILERVVTRLYTERLHDLPAWRVRWYTSSPDRTGPLGAIHSATLERVIGTVPDSGFSFRCMHLRALRSGEVLVLLQDLDNDISRFGVQGGVKAPQSLLYRAPSFAKPGMI